MKKLAIALSLIPLLIALACEEDETTSRTPDTSTAAMTASSSGVGGATTSSGSGGAAGPLALTSTAYMNMGDIPAEHQCNQGQCATDGGLNVSVPLDWTPGPPGTMSYAIVMRDLDFMNGFVHWVIWDIPASVMSLQANLELTPNLTSIPGAKQSQGGYFGMCSCGPNFINTYQFTIYALDVDTLPGVLAGAGRPAAEAAVVGATALATATLEGES